MATYKVKYGDTLSGIARANGTSVQALIKANPTITNANVIRAGASLNLGGTNAGPSTPTPQPTTPTKPTPAPTIAEKASLIPDGTKQDPAIEAYYREQKQAMENPIDEKAMRDEIRKRYNDQFESLRLAAAQKIAGERKLGEGRLGSARALQARSGTLGSNFAGAENDQVNRDTEDIVNSVNSETEAKIAFLMGESEKDYSAQIAAAREAKKRGADEYIKYLDTRDSQRTEKANNLAKLFAAQGIDPSTLSPADVKKLEDTYGVDLGSFKTMIIEEKNKINKDAFFELGDGQSRWVYDPITGQAKQIAENSKNFAPNKYSSGGGGGSSSGGGSRTGSSSAGYGRNAQGNTIKISPTAQIYVDAVNNGQNLDDILKGTSREVQALRGEVIAGLNMQGGQSEKSISLLSEGKSIVDDLINTKGYQALGGYSTKLGGQFGYAYGDASAKASQLSAILARDNLGLLKGAMSDKDLAFIQSMSSGFKGEGVQSEQYIKSRLEQIQTKLSDKINKSGFQKETTTVAQPEVEYVRMKTQSGAIKLVPSGSVKQAQTQLGYQIIK